MDSYKRSCCKKIKNKIKSTVWKNVIKSVAYGHSASFMCLLLRCNREVVNVKKKRRKKVMHSDTMFLLQLADLHCHLSWGVKGGGVQGDLDRTLSECVKQSQGAR